MRKILTMLLIGSVAGLTMGAGGCGGKDDGPKTFTLPSGTYEYTPTTYDPNTCWTAAQAFPPILPFSFIITDNGDGTFMLEGDGIAAGIFPSMEGTIDGNAMDAGPANFSIDAFDDEQLDPDYTGPTPDCTVNFDATADGELTGNGQFDATIEITVSDANGTGCSEFTNDTSTVEDNDSLDLGIPVPFPGIDTGPCTLTPFGTGILQAQ